MAITEAHAGRRYPPNEPYQVSAAKIAEFAAALGDDHPRYRGESPIAPPTFAAIISAPAWNQLFGDPELRRVAGALHAYDGVRRFSMPMQDAKAAEPMLSKNRKKIAPGPKPRSAAKRRAVRRTAGTCRRATRAAPGPSGVCARRWSRR